MPLPDNKPLFNWLSAQSPGRRLGLMLAAIGAVLWALSWLGPDDELVSVHGPDVTAPQAVVDAGHSGPAADAPVPADARPGAAGRPVRTIAVPRTAPAPLVSPAPAQGTAQAVAPTVVPATDASPTSGGRPTKAWRQTSGAASTAPAAGTPTSVFDIPAKAPETKMNIQDVKSPGGIPAWLVEEHSVPLLALRFVFAGGNSQDPAGKEGVANFMSSMLDEGAGDLDAAHFQERMEELALRMRFEDARDSFYGSFETLTANRAPAIEMLKLALNKPRFDAAATDRIRKQLLASLAFAAKNPQNVVARTWSAMAFKGHPYGLPPTGTPESISAIQPADLEAFRKQTFARDTLRVVAVGDIDAKTLGALLDDVFAGLAPKADLRPVPDVTPAATEKLKIVEMDVPQSVVQFGMAGIYRKDPDFIPGYVMNHILGGGGFSSRLTEQVREKRGLAYSVYSYLVPYRHTALFGGGVATRNDAVKQSIDVIRDELARMAKDGPTEAELAGAKSYLTGSFALQFDTNSKIASQLLWMLQEDMGIDYASKRNALIDAVTLADVKRVAARILKADDLLVTVVGKPVGLGKS